MHLRLQRPLWRQAVRLASYAAFGPSMAHAQDWFPHLSLVLPHQSERGTIAYRKKTIAELLPFSEFQRRVGPECAIVGSGPSLRDQRLNRLVPGTCLLLNGAISLAPERISHPLAVAVEDERFAWRHFAMMRRCISRDIPCLFSVSVLRSIAEQDSEWLKDRPVFLINNLLKPYAAPRRSLDSAQFATIVVRDGSAAISLSPELGTIPAGSVLYSALQWAIAAQPETIGFAGVDISNANQPRFYETASDTAPSHIVAAQERILAHLSLAQRICDRAEVKLETYSRISALRTLGIRYSARIDPPSEAHAERAMAEPNPVSNTPNLPACHLS